MQKKKLRLINYTNPQIDPRRAANPKHTVKATSVVIYLQVSERNKEIPKASRLKVLPSV